MTRSCDVYEGYRFSMESNRGRIRLVRRAADDHVRRLFSIEQSVPFVGPGLNSGGVILKEATWLGGAGGSMSRAAVSYKEDCRPQTWRTKKKSSILTKADH